VRNRKLLRLSFLLRAVSSSLLPKPIRLAERAESTEFSSRSLLLRWVYRSSVS
jgi:hypothetical protein